jgi:hypothetical protein
MSDSGSIKIVFSSFMTCFFQVSCMQCVVNLGVFGRKLPALSVAPSLDCCCTNDYIDTCGVYWSTAKFIPLALCRPLQYYPRLFSRKTACVQEIYWSFQITAVLMESNWMKADVNFLISWVRSKAVRATHFVPCSDGFNACWQYIESFYLLRMFPNTTSSGMFSLQRGRNCWQYFVAFSRDVCLSGQVRVSFAST